MTVNIFLKGKQVCYSTSQIVKATFPAALHYDGSNYEKKLIERGWVFVGAFTGRNIVGMGIKTMTEILQGGEK